MTLRLYWADAYLKTFSANVVDCVQHNGLPTPAIVLDQTAFYPTAGGQPHDTGKLNEVEVINVIELPDHRIAHVLAPAPWPSFTTGQPVRGELNWPHRFDHMQQHSGQHVLSQAFVVVLGLETVAVHIGARSGDCTLDLQAPLAALSPANLERVELAANEIVFENRPIRCYELGYDELGRTPLRKPPKKSADGKVRIVEVQDFDWSACGGTHVRSTAEIGLIKLLKAEKRGNDTRIVFRCGGRALQDYARINKDVTKLADTFSVARYDLADTVDRLRAEFQSTRKALESAQTALLEYEARELIATSLTAPQTNGSHARVIQKVFENREMTELRLLAKLLTAQGMGGEGVGVVLLGSAGERSALCFARAGGAAGAGDMGAALKLALATLGNGAKGGGNSDFAQGGGVPATLAQIIEALKAAKQALNLS